jgi:alpha-galactosidase
MASPKISFIGAGSSVFTAQLVSDLLATEGLDEGTFGLVDIDADRLDLSARVVRELVAASGKDWKIEVSTDREEVLPGSRYVINSIEVAGLACVDFDYEILLRYGVDQCIGDTIGSGGIFKALRTGPDGSRSSRMWSGLRRARWCSITRIRCRS